MQYRVEQLATEAGVAVDTVRFYQGRGLLPPPRREGRVAIYSESHLAQLRRIRGLLADGFTLAQIRKLLDSADTADVGPSPDRHASLLAALVEERVGDRTYTRAEAAHEAGVPEALLSAAQTAGLFEPIQIDGEDRFTSADLEMARAGLELLGAGFPLDALLRLATEHANATQRSTDSAIELFDRHVIETADSENEANEAIADAFRSLLPQVTRLVALHFQRTLVNRALARIRARGDQSALEHALAATSSARLEVSWR